MSDNDLRWRVNLFNARQSSSQGRYWRKRRDPERLARNAAAYATLRAKCGYGR